MLESLKKNLTVNKELEKFVREAFGISWAMLTVNPPMLPDISEIAMNDETQRLQTFGVDKELHDSIDSEDFKCSVCYFKPVLYKNYSRDIPQIKGWTGIDQDCTDIECVN